MHSKWLTGLLLLVQAHFCASYLVPLTEAAQREFGGLLGWAWPWAVSDSGPLGTGFQISGFYIAAVAGTLFIVAAFGAVHLWIPTSWWKPAAVAAAVLSLLLMSLYIGPTKLLPIAGDLAVIWLALRGRIALPRTALDQPHGSG